MEFYGNTYFGFNKSGYSRRKKYGGRYKTKRGHFVKSRGELEIANYLADHHEYYQYEKPIRVAGKKLKPDFYMPNLGHNGVYVEYQGMSGILKERRRYKMKQRMYDKNHIPVINLFPYQFGRLGKTLMFKIQKNFFF